MRELEKRMKELKEQLNKLIADVDTCCEGKILAISRELDKAIYEYIKSDQM